MSDSDEDHQLDTAAHRKLLTGINSLVRTQDIQEATRTEPSLKRSEFHLVKGGRLDEDGQERSSKHSVTLEDLLGHLTKTNQCPDVVKDLSMVVKGKRTLQKPLEKPVADRISRDALYGKAQTELELWEPVVTSMEVAPQMNFPLKYGNVRMIDQAPQKISQYRVKTDLMKAMEQLDRRYREPKSKPVKSVEKYALTLEELKQKRKEAALQKMRELYKISKNRRMNKIKSKKYHKLQKREKVRAQIKQFEELQKKDPEAALAQLEAIEKQRYQERATLRHKNTGSWAKNMQIRAKYDMNVRKELAEQLSIGKELMGKRRVNEDESSSESGAEDVVVDDGEQNGNPWIGKRGEHEEEANRQFTSGYRKYWQERNEAVEASKRMEDENGVSNGSESESGETEEEMDTEQGTSSDSEVEKELAEFKQKVQKSKAISTTAWQEEDIGDRPVQKKVKKRGARQEDVNLDELFDEAEEILNQKVKKRVAKIRKSVETNPKKARRKKGLRKKDQKSKLAFKKKVSLADADMELTESIDKNAIPFSDHSKRNILPVVPDSSKEVTIDPQQFVQMKPKHLLNAFPDLDLAGGDLDQDDDSDDGDAIEKFRREQKLTIAEAFEDDDIVADFELEKREEKDRSKPQEVDLDLPGWGSWVGPGINNKKVNRTRRRMLKPAPELPRRDDNREKVIINEDAVNKKLATHLVTELPFPFVSVKDYEASLRAPLGRTFIPETAHATLVEPRVVTKKGTVIEPMKKDILLSSNPAKSFRVGGKKFNKAVKKYEEYLTSEEVAA
ncbi:U3 small nucleolar RNA-associated protein 14 homolog A [Wyeomyia smithii]|uniref:U3 small nucleolar RNA-associated protein 14 homolog A n=1 Tax=Wyeomyia smithii TaxID=174621 RepID=UPI002467DA96|nr:U3 small nucleolar RNA-associated protein 14 homolog A [Wyeomyia smithii]